MRIKKIWFDEWLDVWDKIECSIEGLPAIVKQLIRYSDKEKSEQFEARKKITSYHGIVDMILQTYRSVFTRANFGQELPDQLAEYQDDVDMQGNSTDDMRAIWFEEAAEYGVIWGKVDAPAIVAETEQDAIDAGLRPYCATVSQPHITDWDTDSFGNLTRVVEQTDRIYKDKQVYLVYEQEEIYEATEAGDETERTGQAWPNLLTDEYGRKILPWIREGITKSKKYPGYFRSPLAGVANTGIELYNISSELHNMFYSAAFQFLAGPERHNLGTIGTHRYFGVGQNESFPQWIAPDASLFNVFFEREDTLVMRMFQQAGLKDRTADSSAAAKSAAQVVVEDRRTEDAVKLIADCVERFELKMWKMYSYRLGQPGLIDKIVMRYPDSYDAELLRDALNRLESISKTRNREWYLAELKRIVYLKYHDSDEAEAIIKAAENSTDLRLQELGNVKSLESLLKLGLFDLVTLARDINPKYNTMEDDASVLESLKESAAQFDDVKNEFGIEALNFESEQPV